MRITLVAVGRFGASRGKVGAEKALFENYTRRMSNSIVLKEIEEKKSLTPEKLKQAEGKKLLSAVPSGAVIVALDSRGKELSSVELADKLSGWRDEGIRDVNFVIGGAEGLDQNVTNAAHLVLSLGPMTWPHLLVRVMLVEQLYRAQCILSGHPYHRA
ncbi:MAG: 23S rRNA (pseudouridine(1915)-N(3))-methyltransferase RlmH [Rhodospirillaceae bacterium]|jgi:23S rRNA (pseudouridine1915-N3)-methyltransferase